MFPDYDGGSIVNLMSSIKHALGGDHDYPELSILDPGELSRSSKIMLIVIDGMGYNYVKRNASGTVLENMLKGSMTSVFPSTTGAAIPSFHTGLPPQQHACTGWFMNLKELGAVSTTLLFTPRAMKRQVYPKKDFDRSIVMDKPTFETGINADYVGVRPSDIALETDLGYNSLSGFYRQLLRAAKGDGKRYIFGYWPQFDHLCHEYGVASEEVKEHFNELTGFITDLKKRLEGSGTRIIITADHGMIDTTDETRIDLREYKEIYDCLSLPLCGDVRAVYCYVRLSKAETFEALVKEQLSEYCDIYRSEDLVERGIFGKFTPDKRLYERIGDFVIIPKANYAIVDNLHDKEKPSMVGMHSGVDEDEMLVPLLLSD